MSADCGSERLAAYAVVRLDHYLGAGASLQDRVTVKEVLPSLEEAQREVDRLNALAVDQDRTYFWQYTRYFPAGKGVRGA